MYETIKFYTTAMIVLSEKNAFPRRTNFQNKVAFFGDFAVFLGTNGGLLR
jgi:hypothetical protein